MDAHSASTATTFDDRVEASSGKGADDENFPVASRLIAPSIRPHIMAFYDFVRAADDIADSKELSPEEKLSRLDSMEASLTVAGPLTKPRRLAESFAVTGVPDRHARDMLSAFRQDAVKRRYATIDELWDYCERSACPVGRFLVDVHSEDVAAHKPAADLSAVLQVLNHLQDCQADYLALDRVYIPLSLLPDVSELAAPEASPTVRRAIDALLDASAERMSSTAQMPQMLRSRRFAAEATTVVHLAQRLMARLAKQDPLAQRVKLTKSDFAMACAAGIARSALRR